MAFDFAKIIPASEMYKTATEERGSLVETYSRSISEYLTKAIEARADIGEFFVDVSTESCFKGDRLLYAANETAALEIFLMFLDMLEENGYTIDDYEDYFRIGWSNADETRTSSENYTPNYKELWEFWENK